MVQLLDDLPAVGAGLARLTSHALWVVSCVLIEWNAVLDVRCADEVAASSTVVTSEEPCEGLAADVAGVGRLVGLPVCCGWWACDFAQCVF